MKLEHRLADPILDEEVERYESFRGQAGFPEMYWYGQQDDYNVMIFELLGPSLEDLLVFCGRRFSIKTCLMIMDQLLSRLEVLHSKGLLHRDVKPQNFLMGSRTNGNTVYMTDFGLSREYNANLDGIEHQTLTRGRLIGTTRYASIRGHSGQGVYGDRCKQYLTLIITPVQSQKDDLESLGYMMVSFAQGRLPWQGLKASTGIEKDQLVMEKKMALSAEALCHGLPTEFAEYMRYVKSLKQGGGPDYAKLRKMFRGVARRHGMEYDNIFDWTLRMYLQEKQINRAR